MSNDMHESGRDHRSRPTGTRSTARATGDGFVDLDVSWLVPADLGAVDALARLQVSASRCGRWLRFHGADGGLVELVEFVGLGDVVYLCSWCRSSGPHLRGSQLPHGAPTLGRRLGGEAEQLEQCRVQEDVDAADASVHAVEHLDGECSGLASGRLPPVDRDGR
jgi:hypothetical protein